MKKLLILPIIMTLPYFIFPDWLSKSDSTKLHTFNNISLGVTTEEFSRSETAKKCKLNKDQKNDLQLFSCKEIHPTIKESSFTFFENKLFLMMFEFHIDGSGKITDGVLGKYGKEDDFENGPAAARAIGDGVVKVASTYDSCNFRQWKNSTTVVQFVSFQKRSSKTLETAYHLTIWDKPVRAKYLAVEREKERNKQRKTASEMGF